MSLQVYKDEKAILTANVDLANYIQSKTHHEVAPVQVKTKNMEKEKPKSDYIPTPEDLQPIY